MFASYQPAAPGVSALKRFFELAGPSFLDIPREYWPRMLGMSAAAYHQLFEDLVTFGRIELPEGVTGSVRSLEAVYRAFSREIPDYPGVLCMDVLAGFPAGETIPSEAARRCPVFSFNGGRPLSVMGFLSTSLPIVTGEPYTAERLRSLAGTLWFLEWHVAKRAEYLAGRSCASHEG